jgi:hypothetical protein
VGKLRRFQDDPRFRFDLAAAVTFCVSSTWSVFLFLTCPGHAWRWAANHLTFGLWQTFIMPVAVGIVAATMRFRPGDGQRGAPPLQFYLMMIGVAAGLAVPVVYDFATSKIEPFMLADQRYLELEIALREAHWADPQHLTEHPGLEGYKYATAHWSLPKLSWKIAIWDALLSWFFLAFNALLLYCVYVALTGDRSSERTQRLGHLCVACGLTCLWFPLRHYADWYNQYFFGSSYDEINYSMFFLLIVAIFSWLMLGITAWRARPRVAQGGRSGIGSIIVRCT